MLYGDNAKVETTYFLIQPDDICMNKVGREPTPLHIIKFQKYLQQCTINVPMNGELLGRLGTVLADAD